LAYAATLAIESSSDRLTHSRSPPVEMVGTCLSEELTAMPSIFTTRAGVWGACRGFRWLAGVEPLSEFLNEWGHYDVPLLAASSDTVAIVVKVNWFLWFSACSEH